MQNKILWVLQSKDASQVLMLRRVWETDPKCKTIRMISTTLDLGLKCFWGKPGLSISVRGAW